MYAISGRTAFSYDELTLYMVYTIYFSIDPNLLGSVDIS